MLFNLFNSHYISISFQGFRFSGRFTRFTWKPPIQKPENLKKPKTWKPQNLSFFYGWESFIFWIFYVIFSFFFIFLLRTSSTCQIIFKKHQERNSYGCNDLSFWRINFFLPLDWVATPSYCPLLCHPILPMKTTHNVYSHIELRSVRRNSAEST